MKFLRIYFDILMGSLMALSTVGLIVGMVAILMFAIGCCSFKPEYCGQCPVEVLEVVRNERVVERHQVERVEPPAITSAWAHEQAEADPEGYVEALLADLGAWVNAFFAIDDRVAASNAVGGQ